MAEEPEIVIFPRVKLSELRKDSEIKKLRLQNDVTHLKSSIQDKFKPIHFIIENRKLILGTLTSAIAGLSLFKHLKGKKNDPIKKSFQNIGTGWIKQAAVAGLSVSMKIVVPLFTAVLEYALKKTFKINRT